MRNYFSARFIQWNQHGDDGGGGTVDLIDWAAGADDDELMSNVQIENDNTVAVYPPTYTWTFTYPTEPITVYAQWDKRNWVVFLNYLANFFGSSVYYRDIVNFGPVPAELGFTLAKVGDYSPRKGWKDDSGVLREPTPSDKRTKSEFSGAPGLLVALAALPTYAAKLTAAGRIRDAGIVLYAYQQVIRLNWTITEAFQYLGDNNL